MITITSKITGNRYLKADLSAEQTYRFINFNESILKEGIWCAEANEHEIIIT